MKAREQQSAAEAAGLVYVCDRGPGFRRVRWGRGFRYRTTTGRWLRSATEIGRINSLVIPPAWTDVWICSQANGHLQATGRDERGRKQYRYHERWRRMRSESKFTRMTDFARALPRIRRRVRRDLARKDMSRERVLACVVRLLDVTLIRVGNDEYARENGSFGLTTLYRKHARVDGDKLVFKYVGKSGRTHEVTVDEPRVVQIVTMCLELPNQQLFQYVDDSGLVRDVGSVDVNDYLQVVSGSAFTSKDFRTWGATVSAGRTLVAGGPPFDESGEPLSAAALKRRETAALRAASEAIRNRMATCRAYYVHPRLIDLYADGTLIEAFEGARRARSPRGLRAAERAVLHALGAATRKAARSAGAERVAA